jgi:hypothetical protein
MGSPSQQTRHCGASLIDQEDRYCSAAIGPSRVQFKQKNQVKSMI